MELEGRIIGIISNKKEEVDEEKSVEELVTYRTDDSLKMVNLSTEIKNKKYKDLSSKDKNKVLLASKLQDKEIKLYDFSKGMTKKELDFFKRLFKRITSYNKQIFLYSKDAEIFLNCVDHIYLTNGENVMYTSTSMFDPTIYMEMDPPEIIDFILRCEDLGVRLDEYTDINDLIKAIYRIKS